MRDYLTLSFLPARMFVPLMLLSRLSLLTVVLLRSAISDKVSPFLMVTVFALVVRLRLVLFLRVEATGAALLISTSVRLFRSSSALCAYMRSSLSMKLLICVDGSLIADACVLPLTMLRRYCGLSYFIWLISMLSTLAICSKCTSRFTITVSVLTGRSALIGQMLWSQ